MSTLAAQETIAVIVTGFFFLVDFIDYAFKR